MVTVTDYRVIVSFGFLVYMFVCLFVCYSDYSVFIPVGLSVCLGVIHPRWFVCLFGCYTSLLVCLLFGCYTSLLVYLFVWVLCIPLVCLFVWVLYIPVGLSVCLGVIHPRWFVCLFGHYTSLLVCLFVWVLYIPVGLSV